MTKHHGLSVALPLYAGAIMLWAVAVSHATVNPSISFSNLNPGDTVQLYLSIPVSVSSGSFPISSVEFRVDGALLATVLSAPYQFEWDTTILTNQTTHRIIATVLDTGGGQSSATVDLFVDNGLIPWTQVSGRLFKTATVLTSNGGRVDWSKSGSNLIAYDGLDRTGYYEIYTMKPDGSAQTCLTCGNTQYSKNNGNPAWDPTGQYIAFECQNASLPDPIAGLGTPGAGVNANICVMNKDGSNIQNITSLSSGTGVLHPHFSNHTGKLAWTQMQNPGQGVDGNWSIKIGNFNGTGSPPVTNIQTYQPSGSPFLYELGNFSADDQSLTYSLNVNPTDISSLDEYVLNLQTLVPVDLTNSPTVWDEFPHFTLNDSSVVWMSQQGYTSAPILRTDYWTMNPDGSNQTRMTYFNDPTAPEYILGGVSVTDWDWSPDGTSMVAAVKFNQILNPQGGQSNSLIRIDLNTSPIYSVPVLTSISPSSVLADASGVLLTATGSGFVSGAQIAINGSPVTTTFVSSTQLTATIPTASLAAAGTAAITTLNPGTAASNAVTLTIQPGVTANNVASLVVYPNPWKSNKGFPAYVTFQNIQAGSTVRLFTLSGQSVKTIAASGTTATWDMTNSSGASVASGLYLYIVTDESGARNRGQLTIVR